MVMKDQLQGWHLFQGGQEKPLQIFQQTHTEAKHNPENRGAVEEKAQALIWPHVAYVVHKEKVV